MDESADTKVFDKVKCDDAIETVCKTMNSIGLTMIERWWVATCISKAAVGILGEKVKEFLESHPELTSEKPAE